MIRRSTWILLAVFIVLVGVTWVLQRDPFKTAEVTPTPGLGNLFELSDEQVVSGISIMDSTGKAVEVALGDAGNWMLIQPSGQPVDVDRIETAARQVRLIRILSNLDAVPSLQLIGLEPSVYRLSIQLNDGQELLAFIGNLTPIESGYYARRDGGPVAVVNKNSLDSVLDLFETPPIQPTATPTLLSVGTLEFTPVGTPTAQP